MDDTRNYCTYRHHYFLYTIVLGLSLWEKTWRRRRRRHCNVGLCFINLLTFFLLFLMGIILKRELLNRYYQTLRIFYHFIGIFIFIFLTRNFLINVGKSPRKQLGCSSILVIWPGFLFFPGSQKTIWYKKETGPIRGKLFQLKKKEGCKENYVTLSNPKRTFRLLRVSEFCTKK